MLFKNKIANITVSLSWVFMIIVGSFFILTAYNIVSKYKDNEDAKYKLELQKTLRNIFNEYGRTAGVEENSLAPLKDIFKDSTVEIDCESGIPLLVINEDYFQNEYINTHPTFMTNIKQKKNQDSYLAIENYRMPFKITNMLAIVSVKNLIVFDSESTEAEKLHHKFSKGSYKDLNIIIKDFNTINANSFEPNYIDGKSLNSIIFVTDLNSNYPEIQTIMENNKDIEMYTLELNLDTIRYTDIDGQNYDYNYVDSNNALSLQTMAVFSNPETFECSYNLLSDLAIASYNFYKLKAKNYAEETQTMCSDNINLQSQKGLYNNLIFEIDSIIEELENTQFQNPTDLNGKISSLENAQNQLEQENCPYVY